MKNVLIISGAVSLFALAAGIVAALAPAAMCVGVGINC